MRQHPIESTAAIRLRLHRYTLLAALVGVCIATLVLWSGAASARSLTNATVPIVDLACVSSFQFDFSPPLSFNTVSAQTTASLTSCVSPNSSHPELLSAVLFADRGRSTATGCSPLPITVSGVGSILWNDDTSSVFDFHVSTNPLSDRFGFTADITSGTLAGDRITALPAVVTQDGLCLLGGVNSLSVNLGSDIFTHKAPLRRSKKPSAQRPGSRTKGR